MESTVAPFSSSPTLTVSPFKIAEGRTVVKKMAFNRKSGCGFCCRARLGGGVLVTLGVGATVVAGSYPGKEAANAGAVAGWEAAAMGVVAGSEATGLGSAAVGAGVVDATGAEAFGAEEAAADPVTSEATGVAGSSEMGLEASFCGAVARVFSRDDNEETSAGMGAPYWSGVRA
jgi:hypothetical protein